MTESPRRPSLEEADDVIVAPRLQRDGHGLGPHVLEVPAVAAVERRREAPRTSRALLRLVARELAGGARFVGLAVEVVVDGTGGGPAIDDGLSGQHVQLELVVLQALE